MCMITVWDTLQDLGNCLAELAFRVAQRCPNFDVVDVSTRVPVTLSVDKLLPTDEGNGNTDVGSS